MYSYKDNQLYAESVSVLDIVNQVDTPAYIYSKSKIEANVREIRSAFSTFADINYDICYAVKANSNLSILRFISSLGLGIDVVSLGELKRAFSIHADKIVFSSVGKTEDEIRYALSLGVLTFNVESFEELECIHNIASQEKKVAPISIRVNPEIQAGGHKHISTGTSENKFGVDKDRLLEFYHRAKALEYIDIVGIQAHIGSQIFSVDTYICLLKALLGYVTDLEKIGVMISIIDIGGGFGVDYHGTSSFDFRTFASQISEIFPKNKKLIIEPGRYIVANSGILVSKVLYLKSSSLKNFVIIDGAMTDLLRPSLYDSYHDVIPVVQYQREYVKCDIVGAVCESVDYFAKDRFLQQCKSGDYVAVKDVGAYGFVMTSNYNSRCRPPEILVDKADIQVIRARETFQNLVEHEI